MVARAATREAGAREVPRRARAGTTLAEVKEDGVRVVPRKAKVGTTREDQA